MKPRRFKADVRISRTNLEQEEVIIHQKFLGVLLDHDATRAQKNCPDGLDKNNLGQLETPNQNNPVKQINNSIKKIGIDCATRQLFCRSSLKFCSCSCCCCC